MSGTPVITCTWLIMGHGKVIRYAHSPDSTVFNPLITQFTRNSKVDYLSIALPQDITESTPANGWDAINTVLLSTESIGDKNMTQIQDLCEYYENHAHKNNPLWTIYQGIQPWEKYFTGYINEDEKFAFEENVNMVVLDDESSSRQFVFNSTFDPLCNEHAFCRLMLINERKQDGDNTNEYYGDKTKCDNNSIFEDSYGFIIPTGTMSLTQVWQKCLDKTAEVCLKNYGPVTDRTGEIKYTTKVFIYDSTCNGWSQDIAPSEEKKMVNAFTNNSDESIVNNFFEEIKNQSRWMRYRNQNEEKEDEYNFNQALKFVLNWKPKGESEGGRKNHNGRKKTKSKAYKESKKNRTIKKNKQ